MSTTPPLRKGLVAYAEGIATLGWLTTTAGY